MYTTSIDALHSAMEIFMSCSDTQASLTSKFITLTIFSADKFHLIVKREIYQLKKSNVINLDDIEACRYNRIKSLTVDLFFFLFLCNTDLQILKKLPIICTFFGSLEPNPPTIYSMFVWSDLVYKLHHHQHSSELKIIYISSRIYWSLTNGYWKMLTGWLFSLCFLWHKKKSLISECGKVLVHTKIRFGYVGVKNHRNEYPILGGFSLHISVKTETFTPTIRHMNLHTKNQNRVLITSKKNKRKIFS